MLSGGFDFNLKLNMEQFSMNWNDHKIDDFRPALLNQLGLELVPTNMPVAMLVVEKVDQAGQPSGKVGPARIPPGSKPENQPENQA